MKLITRLLPFFLVGVYFISLNLWHLPTEDISVLQVTTKTQVFSAQSSETIYTTDQAVIEELSCASFERFSLKTTSPETILASLCAVHVSSETAGDVQIEYYFSPLLESYTTVDGNMVNLQVADCGNETAIGYPLIDIGF